jgi:uncharacterized protein YbjT (DUF2867 family)
MTNRPVVVFGGTGFLGRRVVRHLLDHEFDVRVATRHPDHGLTLFAPDASRVQSLHADVHDERSVGAAVAGAHAAVNAVSLYVESAKETFQSVHVEAARRIARCAREAGVERLVHVSGIGADVVSGSAYIRSRGQGEAVVRDEFAAATIVRPAVMFGPDDGFLTAILTLLRRLPAYPMFGRGGTRLQPVCVDDVAEAIARDLGRSGTQPRCYELGGPQVLSYEMLLGTLARAAGLKPMLFPLPFAAWHALARVAEMLPAPPVTRNQVELMERDNVASPAMPGFDALGISPRAIEDVLPQILQNR